MASAVRIHAYVPRPLITGSVEASLKQALSDFSHFTMGKMQDYPAARPWKSRPPRSGLRAGGRRTGNYGRNWRVENDGVYSLSVVNNIRYAAYVGGPKGSRPGQTSNMAGRGWPSVTTVANEARAKFSGSAVKAVVNAVRK